MLSTCIASIHPSHRSSVLTRISHAQFLNDYFWMAMHFGIVHIKCSKRAIDCRSRLAKWKFNYWYHEQVRRTCSVAISELVLNFIVSSSIETKRQTKTRKIERKIVLWIYLMDIRCSVEIELKVDWINCANVNKLKLLRCECLSIWAQIKCNFYRVVHNLSARIKNLS